MAPKAKAPLVIIRPVVDNRTLPPKDAATFKTVLTLYETRAWKKGIKAADLILKSHPEHGETLAMKGLFLTNVDRTAEGFELVKRGVRNDLKSHIVWHVYGLMHRADKNYEEALKCYVQANRIEQDSINILGDLATLQIHLRLYSAYSLSRASIIKTQPRLRRNWIALASAQHLNSEFFEADRTLTSYEESLRNVPEAEYEHSEVLLYHAMILEEWGKFERCLEFLGENSQAIMDRGAYATQRARLLLKLGRTESAEWAWSALVEENADSYEYIKGCVAARGADFDSKTVEGREATVKVLDSLAAAQPRSLAIRRLTLDIVSGEEFRTRASTYIINALSKGIPSIFADIKALYVDLEKQKIVGELVEGYRSSLETNGVFGQAAEGATEETIEASSSYLWTLYFLSHHYSALGSSHQSKALEIFQLAEAHTPSLPELLTLKARILKRGGDVIGAMESMNEARGLDGQDRFLNSKSAKYLIRADKIEEAEACVGLFTKDTAASPLDDLIEMQCLWFMQEEGDSYARQGKLALALKRYQQMAGAFDEIEDDQYDFHTYCLRKSTLRAYVDLVRCQDQLRSHPSYYAAAKGAIEIYLRVHDDPASVAPIAVTNGDAVEASKEDKKAENKARKAEKAAAVKKANKKPEEEENVPKVVVDADPVGEGLLATKDPLGAAMKWLKPLEKCAAGKAGTWELSFEINLRREKYLLAIKALRNLHLIAPQSPTLHLLVLRLILLLPTLSTIPPAVFSAVELAFAEIYSGEKNGELFNKRILETGSDPKNLVAFAKGVILIRGTEGKKEVEEVLLNMAAQAEPDLATSLAAFEILKSLDSARLEEYKEIGRKRFALATAYKVENTPRVELVDEREIMED